MWRLVSFMFLILPQVKETASLRVIMVGWNDRATHLRQAMRRDLAQLQGIIGCVPMPGGRFATPPPPEVAVLGDYSALPQLVVECQANAVILSDVSCSSREIQHLIAFCQREMLNFQLVPAYFPALNSGLQIETMSGVPLLGVRQLPLDRTINRVLKRAMDIAGALVGLGVSAFIIPPFALLVYLESPGPIFYSQRRTSRSGRTFNIYKIRSMRLDAETKSGAVWCQKEDSRRLKIGTFMRKTNIDELPQFWNVLGGDMSLVGPRPERPELIEKFKDTIPNYNARHEVRTAITGWAQIHGLRGDTDLTKRIEADLYYLENWSLLLDLYCLGATFFKVKNAH
jgi:exopolysaccharide biosynthesis polyprenyl glycosylphosphotransferase